MIQFLNMFEPRENILAKKRDLISILLLKTRECVMRNLVLI